RPEAGAVVSRGHTKSHNASCRLRQSNPIARPECKGAACHSLEMIDDIAVTRSSRRTAQPKKHEGASAPLGMCRRQASKKIGARITIPSNRRKAKRGVVFVALRNESADTIGGLASRPHPA